MSRTVSSWKTRLIAAAALTVAFAIGTGSFVRAQAPSAGRSEAFDDAGVRAAVMKRIEGQRTRDAALGASVFADDAVWINAFGVRVVGRTAIEKFLAGLYADSGFAQAQMVVLPHIEEIVFVRPDVAVARTFVRLEGQRLASGTVIADRRVHNTMTMTREPGGWKVRYEIVTDERTAPPKR